MIFESFFVLATLLSTGIGGLGGPVRRQNQDSRRFTLVNQDPSGARVCIDAGPDISGTVATLKGCNGQSTQVWNATTGLSQVTSQGGNCLGIDGTLIVLQGCDDSNTEWLLNPNPDVIGTVDNVCMTNSGGQVAAEGCTANDDQIISAVPL